MTVTAAQVLEMLRPNGGYYISGDDYDTLIIEEGRCEPISRAEFEAGFESYENWKAEQLAIAKSKRDALLDRLGITADEAKLLLQ